jgi:serine/threonine protein kinase
VGEFPFLGSTCGDLPFIVKKGTYILPLGHVLSLDLKDLLDHMLAVDPAKRATAEEVGGQGVELDCRVKYR